MGKLDKCRKVKLDHLLTSHTRKNSKWTKDLNVRPQTIKIPEENTGSKISDSVCRNFSSDISPQGRKTKKEINKWDYLKLKSVCIAKKTIQKIKKNPQNGRTYLSIHVIRG